MEGSHLDGDKQNNHFSNLAWETPAANSARRVDHHKLPQGETHGLARLSAVDIAAIRARASQGENYAAIGRTYGVHRNNVRSIVIRRTWKHVA